MVPCTCRWEAEEQQHQEYLDKMKRVDARRKANLAKQLAAGFTCTMEKATCGKHFDSKPLFNQHLAKHKGDMRARLVCTEETTKTTVCEEKFTNRRAYTQHIEGHRSKRLKAFQQNVRSVLLVNRLGLLVGAFEKEFRMMVGQMVPYKALGCQGSLELLQQCPEVVEVRKLEDGNTLLVGIPDDRTEHMAKMIGSQKAEARGYDYRTGEVLKKQSSAAKRDIQKVAGRRARLVTPFLREQVRRMMELEEHEAGLELEEFMDSYKALHDYPLEPQYFGFAGVQDLLHHGLQEVLALRLGVDRRWTVHPLRLAPSHALEPPRHLRTALRALLAPRPGGVEVEALPLVYGGALEPREFGYSSLEELCLALAIAGDCSFKAAEGGEGPWILPVTAPAPTPAPAATRVKSKPKDHATALSVTKKTVESGWWGDVVEVAGEKALYVQALDTREELWHLEDQMEEHYSRGGGKVAVAEVGATVVHLSPVTGVWCRGEVVEVHEEEVEVRYLDYGGVVRVASALLRRLEQRFSRLAGQVVEVRRGEVEEKGEVVWVEKRGDGRLQSCPVARAPVWWGKVEVEQEHLEEEEVFRRTLAVSIARVAIKC